MVKNKAIKYKTDIIGFLLTITYIPKKILIKERNIKISDINPLVSDSLYTKISKIKNISLLNYYTCICNKLFYK